MSFAASFFFHTGSTVHRPPRKESKGNRARFLFAGSRVEVFRRRGKRNPRLLNDSLVTFCSYRKSPCGAYRSWTLQRIHCKLPQFGPAPAAHIPPCPPLRPVIYFSPKGRALLAPSLAALVTSACKVCRVLGLLFCLFAPPPPRPPLTCSAPPPTRRTSPSKAHSPAPPRSRPVSPAAP